MLKDETICIRCGLCAQRCPVHTITMEAFQVFDRAPEGDVAVLEMEV
jgi:ferredoxin